MRALILLFAITAFADISWVRKGKYKTEWTKIYQTKGGWYCDSDIQKRVPLKEEGKEAIKQLEQGKPATFDCKSRITVVGLGKEARDYCLESKNIWNLFESLDKSCGR